MARQSIGKKTRFEVFKRDKFTCQYCGAKAPDVVLQVDHIQAVAEGGASDLMNLITSCQPCNAGKGARALSDDTVVERQRQQIEELEERRQQLEMMLQWREELSSLRSDTVEAIAEHIAARAQLLPNENGKQDIRRWLKRYSPDEILAAIDEAMDIYLEYEGDRVTNESWNKAFSKIPGVASIRKQQETKPYLRDLFYIQGILRNRTRNKWLKCVSYLEEAHQDGVPISYFVRIAKLVEDWQEFDDAIRGYLDEEARAR